MYGYVRVHKPEMKIRDFEIYRGFYCSLCDTLSRRYGPLARLFLSYDLTIFTIFMLSQQHMACGFKQGRCRLNPAKKCLKATDARNQLELSADITIILLYFKLHDTIDDSRFFKRLSARFALLFLICRVKKARRLRPEIYTKAADYYDRQFRAEHTPHIGIDGAAAPTADFTAYLASVCAGGSHAQAAYDFGYMLGRFIYIADAADDLPKDLKRRSFNPFIKAYNINSENLTEKLPQCMEVLEMTAARTDECYAACDVDGFRAITDNVVSLGLFAQIDLIRKKYEEVTT